MKNHSFLFIFPLLAGSWLLAQKHTDTLPARQNKGKQNVIAFGFYLPAGVFSQSHFAGAGIDYSRSHYRFGKNISPDKFIGFIVNGGVNYYAGKRITTAGFDFRYGGFINLYAMPGIIYNPVKHGNVSLLAGPALNIYKKSATAGFGINLLSNYFISENIAMSPGIIYKKHINTDALWAITIRASYIF